MNASEAARVLRAIPSEKRAQASRENGKKGGRPREWKSGSFSARGRRGFVILFGHGAAVDMDGAKRIAEHLPEGPDRERFLAWAEDILKGDN